MNPAVVIDAVRTPIGQADARAGADCVSDEKVIALEKIKSLDKKSRNKTQKHY